MEDKPYKEEENATLNYRGKYCLIKYILHLLKDDTEKIIRQKSIKIDIDSTSSKSTIGNINYTMLINSLHYSKKLDIRENIPKIQKINGSNYTIRDEFNNNINYNEISIKVNLMPTLNKKTIIDFDFFNFFFYNGKRFHKFVLTPTTEDDQFFDKRCKLFIYFYYYTKKSLCENLLRDLDKLTQEKNFWNVISHIYIILPVKDRNTVIEKHEENLEYLKIKENKIPKMSIVYLSEDIKDGNAINIFTNYYQETYTNYFFILNHSNKVKLISSILNIYPNFIKFSEEYIKIINPVETYKNEKRQKKQKLIKFFNFLSNFIDDIPNLEYLFDFNFNMRFSILLDEPGNYFKLNDIYELEVGGSLRTNEYNKFKNLYDEIQNDKLRFKLTELKTIDIPINFNKPFICQVCKKEIPNNKECYYCYICVQFYCYTCVKNHINSKIGINKFIDKKHNLLFFKTRELKNFTNVDEKKLGKNSFTKSSSFKSSHSATCDGCGSGLYGGQRFICLTCKPGIYLSGGYCDYCNICIEHMIANDDKGKLMQQKISTIQYSGSMFCKNHSLIDKHDHETHIYLMVPLEGILSDYQGY